MLHLCPILSLSFRSTPQPCTVSSLLKPQITAEGRGWDQTPRYVLSRIVCTIANFLIQTTHPRLTACTVTQDDLHLASYFTAPTSLPLHFSLSSSIKSNHSNQPKIYDLFSPTNLSGIWPFIFVWQQDHIMTIDSVATCSTHRPSQQSLLSDDKVWKIPKSRIKMGLLADKYGQNRNLLLPRLKYTHTDLWILLVVE